MPLKRKIILFLLNLIGGNKNQENEEEKGARRTGCGCLLAIAFAPFLHHHNRLGIILADVLYGAGGAVGCLRGGDHRGG